MGRENQRLWSNYLRPTLRESISFNLQAALRHITGEENEAPEVGVLFSSHREQSGDVSPNLTALKSQAPSEDSCLPFQTRSILSGERC